MARSKTGSIATLILLNLALQVGLAQQKAPAHSTPKRSEDYSQVETLLQQGHLDQAKAEILKQIQQHPSSADAYLLLGIIESNQRDFVSATTAFQKAVQLAPMSTKAHNNLGNVYLVQKKSDLAEKEFRTVLRSDPANQDANYNLGVLLMAKGTPTQAIPLFEKARRSNPAATLNLIHAYLLIKHDAQALQLATELSAQNKDSVQIHFSLGVLLASDGQYKLAQVEITKANALQPNTFEILYNLGQVQFRNGDGPQAEASLARALKLQPESAEALYLLAQVYTGESRPLDALDLLVAAHKIAPENTDVIFLMAKVSISQNYYEDAIPLLESGLKIAPQRTDLRAALGQSYFMSGKVDKSIEQFEKLIAQEPSARAYSFLGLSYRNLGRFEDAKLNFQKGLKLDPHDSSCLFNLGLIAERQGDPAAAETMFQQTLKFNPDYPDALLELANLRIAAKRFPEAADLLRKFVKVSHTPDTGYYKLAMVERSMKDNVAADRDLAVFQSLSKNAATGPYPYEHLFDYLDTRSKLAPGERQQMDITELIEQNKKNPNQPENLYLLAEAYLKSGKIEDARNTIGDLDKVSATDFRTLTGTGVLLARYRLYDDAIQHFQAALQADPGSDEIKYDLADAYFRKRKYSDALATAQQVSEEGRKDESYLALLGDIYAHLGEASRAEEIYRSAIARNPDNDQDYLALALLQFRQNDVAGAKETLLKGQARIPISGKLTWGLGIASVLEGKTAQAAEQFEQAVDRIPEWPGSYSTLGVFYFETGQIDKAKEVLNRFKNSNVHGALDINRIAQVLERAPATTVAANEPMTAANKAQLLQLALSLADRTL